LFGQLPNIFERNFVVGYFLPIVAFEAAFLRIASAYGQSPIAHWLKGSHWLRGLDFDQTTVLLGTAVFVLVSVFNAIVLLSLNPVVMSLMQGNGALNPARLLFLRRHRKRYDELVDKQHEIEDMMNRLREGARYDHSQIEPLQVQRANIIAKLIIEYPSRRDQVLPTVFGNRVRAFYAYPFRMYGLDSQGGWNRLLGVIPTDYRTIVDTAKANTDFWVNLCFLSFVVLFQWITLAIYTHSLEVPLLAVAVLLVLIAANIRARTAATEWGDLVKSAFDVFLPDLRKQLGLRTPPTMEAERRLWSSFSQALIYGNPYSLDHLATFRAEDKDRLDEDPSS
jgi:hypothetical protein